MSYCLKAPSADVQLLTGYFLMEMLHQGLSLNDVETVGLIITAVARASRPDFTLPPSTPEKEKLWESLPPPESKFTRMVELFSDVARARRREADEKPLLSLAERALA